ncbi:hypothetical protein CP533_4446 [Ophiocordyceps camponoti-saundersi (nom. inval.)]|nr:hypothetical protein CP533_4446 [Ophiocordyceps camponoti-saundersi (nom. inval.)]
MAKPRGHAKKLAEFDETIVRDDDIEGEKPRSDDDSTSDAEDVKAATEHYVPVGKSRLRNKDGVSLGRDYRGSRVSRWALEEASEAEDSEDIGSSEGEFDDPDAMDVSNDEARAGDSEIDSDNAFAESDAERFDSFSFRGSSKPRISAVKSKKRASAADYMTSDEEEDGRGEVTDEDEDDEEGDEEDEEASANDDDGSAEDESDGAHEKAQRPAEQNFGSKQTDRDKGMAIQRQRKIYDGLLNLRIRLQKALVAVNTLPTLEDVGPSSDTEAYEAAEEAAIKLLNTMSSLRDNVSSQRTGDKRKRRLSASMSSETIWESLEEEDTQAGDFRRERLEKWWRKVQSVSVTAPKGLGHRNKTLVEGLEEQLANPDGRLLKRTRVPRSCAPVQAGRKVTEDEQVYDDADFYQLLLKELVDQRTVETWTAKSSGVRSVMLTATKERKQVDRKASKGRKMRFTVHEKLQNLMAPEDRRSWEEAAIDRLFGTLFGQKMALDEEEDGEEEGQREGSDEGGLRLFR